MVSVNPLPTFLMPCSPRRSSSTINTLCLRSFGWLVIFFSFSYHLVLILCCYWDVIWVRDKRTFFVVVSEDLSHTDSIRNTILNILYSHQFKCYFISTRLQYSCANPGSSGVCMLHKVSVYRIRFLQTIGSISKSAFKSELQNNNSKEKCIKCL